MKDVYILPATTPLERENIHVTHLNYNVVPNVQYHYRAVICMVLPEAGVGDLPGPDQGH